MSYRENSEKILTHRIIAEICDERRRQVEKEGWTPEHDDQHAWGDMAVAAMGYCQSAALNLGDTSKLADHPPAYWRWDAKWWKPTNSRRDLIKAAALIVAEIERIDRIEGR